MTYLSLVPLATFAVVALLVLVIPACIAFAEKRRRRLTRSGGGGYSGPTVIDGGKVDNPEATPPILETENPGAEVKPRRPRIRLSMLP